MTAANTTSAAPAPTDEDGPRGSLGQAVSDYVAKVKSGDTLYAIALRYNTTVDALVASNGLRTPETILAIGQKLVLP